jgi:hypothetical protein
MSYDTDLYSEVVTALVKHSNREPGFLEIGEDISAISGIKVIFDGYGYDEETDEEGADVNLETYAVFIHRNSLTEEFPEHDLTPWGLIHRPKEEVCIYVWYDVEREEFEVQELSDILDEGGLTEEEVMAIITELNETYFTEE